MKDCGSSIASEQSIISVRIKEGDKERIQIFQGTVIKRQNAGLNETFTVRKISSGVGVERTFPVHSPKVAKIEVTRKGKVRRAKLYYLRDRVGKAAKTKEKQTNYIYKYQYIFVLVFMHIY